MVTCFVLRPSSGHHTETELQLHAVLCMQYGIKHAHIHLASHHKQTNDHYCAAPQKTNQIPTDNSGVACGGGGVQPPPPIPKFWQSQFRGKYISNYLIRIRVSLICKLSGTPDKGATAPRAKVLGTPLTDSNKKSDQKIWNINSHHLLYQRTQKKERPR
jgi:hypothetical protein